MIDRKINFRKKHLTSFPPITIALMTFPLIHILTISVYTNKNFHIASFLLQELLNEGPQYSFVGKHRSINSPTRSSIVPIRLEILLLLYSKAQKIYLPSFLFQVVFHALWLLPSFKPNQSNTKIKLTNTTKFSQKL